MDGTIEPISFSERLTMKRLNYKEGFEDSLKLTLEKINKTKGKQNAL